MPVQMGLDPDTQVLTLGGDNGYCSPDEGVTAHDGLEVGETWLRSMREATDRYEGGDGQNAAWASV